MNESETAERAARFLEKYTDELYPLYLGGARYHKRRPVLDFDEAQKLCATWTDERLEMLAIMFLKSNHPHVKWCSTKSIAQFAAVASWVDQRLCDWEAKQ